MASFGVYSLQRLWKEHTSNTQTHQSIPAEESVSKKLLANAEHKIDIFHHNYGHYLAAYQRSGLANIAVNAIEEYHLEALFSHIDFWVPYESIINEYDYLEGMIKKMPQLLDSNSLAALQDIRKQYAQFVNFLRTIFGAAWYHHAHCCTYVDWLGLCGANSSYAVYGA